MVPAIFMLDKDGYRYTFRILRGVSGE